MKINIIWFRRDLRVEDNTALQAALESGLPVLPLFIFDNEITGALPRKDARISFIYGQLSKMDQLLRKRKSGFMILNGDVIETWQKLIQEYEVDTVYWNRDYEPYAITRDEKIKQLLEEQGIAVDTCKDQVVMEPGEVLKKDGKPYTVFTPYKNSWLKQFMLGVDFQIVPSDLSSLLKHDNPFPQLEELGFDKSAIRVKPYQLDNLQNYAEARDYPVQDSGSYLGPHLRFGTISIRQVISGLLPEDEVFMSELIWREFFMQILANFPRVVKGNFKEKYNGIAWRNREDEFEKWKAGKTGYALVDAGMRELNQTGYMHNRVRMITAGFLCKHLLIDWRWGESYFAEKLLDYELSSNNGNWQWAAGTGCDAAPYFRIFNPYTQFKKFDRAEKYVKRWVPEYGTKEYCEPIVEHKFARARCLQTYRLILAP